MRLKQIRIGLLALLAVVALVGAGLNVWYQFAPQSAPTAKEAVRTAITADFELTDHTGNVATEDDFRGNWLLVFFGFTNCPDVCPTTLNEVSRVVGALGKDGDRVQPLFITVDPERDTPEAMAEYVAAFHPRIVGLTGTLEQVKQAAQSFKVYFGKVNQEGAPDGYTMDHSAHIYLINPDGKFEAAFIFANEDSVDEITNELRKYL